MPTTVIVKDDAYKVIMKKQTEIYSTTGEKRHIRDIVEQSIIAGIEFVK